MQNKKDKEIKSALSLIVVKARVVLLGIVAGVMQIHDLPGLDCSGELEIIGLFYYNFQDALEKNRNFSFSLSPVIVQFGLEMYAAQGQCISVAFIYFIYLLKKKKKPSLLHIVVLFI